MHAPMCVSLTSVGTAAVCGVGAHFVADLAVPTRARYLDAGPALAPLAAVIKRGAAPCTHRRTQKILEDNSVPNVDRCRQRHRESCME